MKYELLMARAGEGAGDQMMALNCAHAWAKLYNVKVELEYHWNHEEDFKVVPSDQEQMAERTNLMHSKMMQPELVKLEHVWGSDVFEYHNSNNDLELRRLIRPRKWFFPKGRGNLHRRQSPFGAQSGQAEWSFSESPSDSRKIVMWDFEENLEAPKDFKMTSGISWKEIRATAKSLFPDYEFVHLTYRDSFERAYSEIKDCSFCLGYDGMWHLVARNFGKLFVTSTSDILHPHKLTNPLCSAFRGEQIFGYLEKLSKEPFLRMEQSVARNAHSRRMSFYYET